MRGFYTVKCGSRGWCDQWAKWYWNRALGWADRIGKPGFTPEFCTLMAMYCMFESYRWEGTDPWA